MTDWYWKECVSEAFEDAGISATDEQTEIVASWIEGAHDNYGMATGLDVACQNLRSSRERELEDAKRALEREQAKVHCKICDGTGENVTHGPYHSSSSRCWKCNGQGRHDP